MFAPKVAKAQTNAAKKSPTRRVGPERSPLAARPSARSAAEHALLLPRSIGNQAALRRPAQRTTSKPDRHDGQEAEPASLTVARATPGVSWDFSKIRRFSPGSADRPQPSSPFAATPPPGAIQAKLAVGQVNDPLEREVDRVVAQVTGPSVTAHAVSKTPGIVPAAVQRRKAADAPDQRVGDLGAGAPPVPQIASSPTASGVQFDLSRVPIHPSGGQIHDAARLGTSGPGTSLPYFDRIQESFGRHSVAGAQAHSGAIARAASDAIGANAFTTAGHIAFATPPNLRIAAHEAAHIVQQRAGLNLDGGVGRIGDRHERHADAVADRVMRGESSEALLDQYAGTGGSTGVVVQKDDKRATSAPANAKKGEVRLKDDGENITTEDDKELRIEDPFEHSILIFNKQDKTWKRQMYTLVQNSDGTTSKQMGPAEDISEARARALKAMNQKTVPFAQETEAGAAARVASDDAIFEAKKEAFDHKDEYPARLAKYQSDLDAYKQLSPDEKKKAKKPQPPLQPPAVRPAKKSKTTKCVDWPAQVYSAAGVTSKNKITFGPPKTLNSWRTFDQHPEGPKAGDVYYIWDEVNNQAAHMGEFKSAVKIPKDQAGGKDNLQRWVVTDGGQGDGYEKVNFIYERQRIFDPADQHFYDKAADAGATTAGRRLEGWVDIDVQIADEAQAGADKAAKAAAAAPKSNPRADAR